MPELPEVETTRRGIIDHIKGKKIERVIVRQSLLRWPVPEDLCPKLSGQSVYDVQRRAKYLLLRTRSGTLLIHLGIEWRVLKYTIVAQAMWTAPFKMFGMPVKYKAYC